jgi:hypothetical protein
MYALEHFPSLKRDHIIPEFGYQGIESATLQQLLN